MGMEIDPQGAAAAPPPAAYPASSGPAPQAPCPPPGADGHSVQGGMGAAPAWPAIPQPPADRSPIVFRGKRLIVAPRCARHFGIVDIKVGNRGQLLSSEAMPASAFMGSSRSVKLHLDTATVGQDVTIIVVNLSRRARTFEAVVIGSEAS